eukprot:gene10391-2920_t
MSKGFSIRSPNSGQNPIKKRNSDYITRKSIELSPYEELSEKTYSVMLKPFTKCENDELNVEETLNYLLVNLTIVMRDKNYKNQLTKFYPLIKRSIEQEENEEMKQEIESMKYEYFELLKIKNNPKSEIKEITMKQLNYKSNWREFFDKIQKKYSPNACIINSDCTFLNNRWVNKLEDKIIGLKVDPVEDKIFAIVESSFLRTIDSQVNVEMCIKKSQNKDLIWEKEVESNLSEYRYNQMKFALNPEKYAKIDSLEFLLGQLLEKTTDLEICETVNYIDGGNRNLKGTFFSEIEKTFDKFLNQLYHLNLNDLLKEVQENKRSKEIEQKIEKYFRILNEGFPEISLGFDFQKLEEKLKFMKIALIELELSNSFIDFYASLTNAICSIQNIFAIRQSHQDKKSKGSVIALSFLGGNSNNDLIESSSSPASPILSISSSFRKSVFENEIEDLKLLEPHHRLKNEKSRINTELVEPTNPMDLGLISSIKNVKIQIKKLNEKGLVYLMNQKDMKMNEFMDNYLSINSIIFDNLKNI